MRKQKRSKRTKRARGGGIVNEMKAKLIGQKLNTTKGPNFLKPKLSLNNLRSRITNKSKLINYKGVRGTYEACSSGVAPIDGKCPAADTYRTSNGTTITNVSAPAAGGRR